MKHYVWNTAKNEILKSERNVSFEEVVIHINAGRLLAVLEHPNLEKYPGQRLFIVEMHGYAWIVPFVETANEIVLKTVIPSRKATKQYLGSDHEDLSPGP